MVPKLRILSYLFLIFKLFHQKGKQPDIFLPQRNMVFADGLEIKFDTIWPLMFEIGIIEAEKIKWLNVDTITPI